MRPTLALLVVLGATACAPDTFDNPLDPANTAGRFAVAAEQAGVRAVRLSWAPLGSPSVTGYRVYRKASEGQLTQVREEPAGSSGWTDYGLDVGTRYLYQVTAFAEGGAESAPSAPVEVEVAPTEALDAEAAQAGIGRVHLTWAPPGQPWVKKVRVERQLGEAGPREEAGVVDAAEGDAFDDVDEAEDPYFFYLTALDEAGVDGAESMVGPLRVFSAYTYFSTMPERHIASPDRASFEWDAFPGAARYRVEQRKEGETAWTTSFETEGTSGTATDLVINKEYGFVLRALGANGKSTIPGDTAQKPPPRWLTVFPDAVSAAAPTTQPTALYYEYNTSALFVVYRDEATSAARVYRMSTEPMGIWADITGPDFAVSDSPAAVRFRSDSTVELLFAFGALGNEVSAKLHRVGLPGMGTPFASVSLSPQPAPSRGHSVFYDGELSSLFVVGGELATFSAAAGFWVANSTMRDKMVRLDFANDTDPPTVAPDEDGPGPVQGGGLVQTDNGDVYLFGGASTPDGFSGAKNELWRMNPRTATGWAQVNDAGGPPRARVGIGAAFTGRFNSLWLAGGYGSDHTPLDDVWEFTRDDDTWRKWTTTGAGPPAGAWAVTEQGYPAQGSGLLVFAPGGAWQLPPNGSDPAVWKRAEPPAPGTVAGVWAFDPASNDAFLVGGATGDGSGSTTNDDVYALSLLKPSQWTRVASAGTHGGYRDPEEAIVDPENRILYYRRWGGGLTVDTLTLGANPTWGSVTGQGDYPQIERTNPVLALTGGEDARVLWVVGGTGPGVNAGDVFRLDLSTDTWTNLTPAEAARPTLTGEVGCFDRASHRVYVKGLTAEGYEAWGLDLDADPPAWTKILSVPQASHPLTPMQAACASSDGAVYFLERVEANGSDELWRVDLAAKTLARISTVGPTPGPREGGFFYWHEGIDQLVLAHGRVGTGLARADVWRMELR